MTIGAVREQTKISPRTIFVICILKRGIPHDRKRSLRHHSIVLLLTLDETANENEGRLCKADEDSLNHQSWSSVRCDHNCSSDEGFKSPIVRKWILKVGASVDKFDNYFWGLFNDHNGHLFCSHVCVWFCKDRRYEARVSRCPADPAGVWPLEP